MQQAKKTVIENTVAVLEKEPETKDEISVTDIQEPAESVNPEKLKAVILEIIQDFKFDHKNLEITVLKQPYELLEEKIFFYVGGEIQEGVFQKIKPEVLKLLRAKLNNKSLTLHVEIREDQSHHETKLYTSSDKLSYLKKKSKAFEELQRRFGLETDF